jgi:hypothetical protein
MTSKEALENIKKYLLEKLKEDGSELGFLIIKENVKVIEEKLNENEMSVAEHLTLLYDKNLALSLLQTQRAEYDKLVEKIKELVLHYSEFEMYGKNYNAIFKTIIELKEMIGYEDE